MGNTKLKIKNALKIDPKDFEFCNLSLVTKNGFFDSKEPNSHGKQGHDELLLLLLTKNRSNTIMHAKPQESIVSQMCETSSTLSLL